MNRIHHLPIVLLLVLTGCAGPPSGPSPARAGHPGFDTAVFPGEEVLRSWRSQSPYSWVGYYLPAPCHRGTSWVGRRALLEQQGWGIAVLYVGQQAFEGAAAPDSQRTGPIICSRTLLTEEQGRTDARDAVAKAMREGFPAGSVIYLDVERMQQIPPEMLTYYLTWQREVLADGRYLPGTYAHQLNAPPLFERAQTAYREAGRAETPPFWIAGGRAFSLDQPPWAVGLPYARIWQGTHDVPRTWAGRSLVIDENVADRPSPSAPLVP